MEDQSFTHLGKPNTGDYYEGSRAYMRAIYPRPYVATTTFPGSAGSQIIFREDFYDPTTRIRRGRFYQTVASFPVIWDRVWFDPYQGPLPFLHAMALVQSIFSLLPSRHPS